jgi:hypothetical protein
LSLTRQAEAIAHTPSAMVQQTLNLSPETIADFARQVQDIIPARLSGHRCT